MHKIINKIKNGKVFQCESCNKIHIEYKNLYFIFNQEKYKQFADYFLKMDGEYFESRNAKSFLNKKIVIPVGNKNLKVIFDNDELNEIKSLLLPKPIIELCCRFFNN